MKAGHYIRYQYEHALRAAKECEAECKGLLQKAAASLDRAEEHREAAIRWAKDTDIIVGQSAFAPAERGGER